MKKTLLLFVLFYSIFGYSQKGMLDSIQIKSSEVPQEFKSLNELKCQSIQSKMLYDKPEMYGFILGNVVDKKYQTYEYEGNEGSILFLEFDKDVEDSKAFIEGLLWGGKKPSKAHPEKILIKDKLMIILSFPYKSKIGETLTEIISKK